MADYIPRSDAEFNNWQVQNLTFVESKYDEWKIPAPATAPTVKIDFSKRFQHEISFFDAQRPASRAKPEGVYGCEIWIKLDGEPPVSADELRYIATDTFSPYIMLFDGTDGGKTAYYWLRWVNKKGQVGPWSATAAAIVNK